MFEEMDVEQLSTTYVISVAAELAGMHPQTLRQYDRLGLVTPRRTRGRGRRYSHADVLTLREIQRLSQEEGINLSGIKRIMALRRKISELKIENQRLQERVEFLEETAKRIFAVNPNGVVSPAMRSPNRASVSQRELIRYRSSRQIVCWRP